MKISDYIASYLAANGVSDAFGIPGGVILDLVYAFDSTEGITPHLNFHEQSAGFAACGYAQMSGKLGVAYATRGPGFTNLLTPMADAFYDSIPVMFLTGHASSALPSDSRAIDDQEMDSCAMVKKITKYAKRIDSVDELGISLREAYHCAMEGRRGPVFLDIKSSLFSQEIELSPQIERASIDACVDVCILERVAESIRNSKRPVVLVGDGINQCCMQHELNRFIERASVPVISSRYSHNVINDVDKYYGYIGSHGVRYANFILSKADLVISLGNRLNFPDASQSFKPIVEKSTIIQFDVDCSELARHSGVKEKCHVDLFDLMPALACYEAEYGDHGTWLETCCYLKDRLYASDCNSIVLRIVDVLSKISADTNIVCDVGNNEFWTSRACVFSKSTNRTLYSKSFGALGNALGKAIGAYYANHKKTVVFIGDQGLQLNIQELQYISQHRLPITIVILDNSSSGMIKDRELATKHSYFLHTTLNSGFGNPVFAHVARAYGMAYSECYVEVFPSLVHVKVNENCGLEPSLLRGRAIQDMTPELEKDLFDELNRI